MASMRGPQATVARASRRALGEAATRRSRRPAESTGSRRGWSGRSVHGPRARSRPHPHGRGMRDSWPACCRPPGPERSAHWPDPPPGSRSVLICCRLQVDGVVQRERAIDDRAGDLLAIGHLAQGRRLDGRKDVGDSQSPSLTGLQPCTSLNFRACARSMAFCTMSTFSARVGAMLTAASDTINVSR